MGVRGVRGWDIYAKRVAQGCDVTGLRGVCERDVEGARGCNRTARGVSFRVVAPAVVH